VKQPTLPASTALISRSERVQATATGWLVQCPAHDDHSPSLHVSERAGRVLVRCFAGCSPQAVADYLKGWDGFFDGAKAAPTQNRPVARGEPYCVSRFPWDGGEARHMRQDYDTGKRMWWEPKGVKPAQLPLYGTLADGDVVLCEGETPVDALRHLEGFSVLGTVTGAASIPETAMLCPIFGRGVILWPDNDEPGREHMQRIGRILVPHCLVYVVRWRGLDKADAADAVKLGADIYAILRDALPFQPEVEARGKQFW